MSMPKGKKPAKATRGKKGSNHLFLLSQADAMLPLVKVIAEDIQKRWQHLVELEKEQIDLERRRRELDWPQRSRRYAVNDEITTEQGKLRDSVLELEDLNVILVDPVVGETAFPTMVQGRKAYFVWRVGAEQVKWWCFANEPQRRIIPESWRVPAETNTTA
ncbi:MAG TPA: DUF2203 family protein [Gemmatales bacterium]|nr:DUF2203 family protein [Gemmatales bacterium]HMP16177.1 DUF2203 family protein [Gemmatales bacterium]